MKSVMIAVHLLGEQHFTPKSLIYINKAASFAMRSRIQEYYRRHQQNVSNSKVYGHVRLNHIDRIKNLIHKLSKFLYDDITHLRFLKNTYVNVSLLEARVLNCRGVGQIKDIDNHLMKLNRLKRGLATRMRLAKMSRAKRFINASKFYYEGGYRSFSGWKSFAVDVIKPQAVASSN